jgi:hypothetical protein
LAIQSDDLSEELSPLPTQYLNEVKEYFKKYQDHEAISNYKNFRVYQANFPARYAFYLDNNFKQAHSMSQRDSLDLMALGGNTTKKLFKEIHNFAKATTFKEFIKNHRRDYRDMLLNVSDSLLSNGWIGILQDFFGDNSPKKWTVYFAPLTNSNDFSITIDSSTAKTIPVLYAFQLPIARDALNKKVTFPISLTLKEDKASIFFRESAQNYTLIAFNINIENLRSQKVLFSSNKDKDPDDWKQRFQATVNRAIAGVLLKTYISPSLGTAELEWQSNNGYPYTQEIANWIEKEYLTNRGKYKDFSSFYPVIIQHLGKN